MNKYVLWTVRILVGILFIFSGFIKANDPYGFAYKLDEYFQIFHIAWLEPYSVFMSVVICSLEVLMGVWLLIGFKPVLNTWALILLIVFFDFLTGYTALANLAKANPSWTFSHWMARLMAIQDENPELINALSDCGCFGDFIKLQPWQSFLKDVVLTILIVILFRQRYYMSPVFKPVISALVSFVAAFMSISFPVICYYTLPYIDFLPYKAGNDLLAQMTIPANAPTDSFEYRFIYKNKKNGEEKIFGMTQIPSDSEWVFVDSKHKLIREGYHPPIHDFKLFDRDGNEYTDIITEQEGYKLLIISTRPDRANPDNMRKIARLTNDLKKEIASIQVLFLTSFNADSTQSILKYYGFNCPAYQMDGTVIKSIVRANPGLMLLKKSTVIRKWSGFVSPIETAAIIKYMQ